MGLLEAFDTMQRRALLARGVTSHTAQVRGTTVHFYLADLGAKGPPLVLLHGLGASAHNFILCTVPFARSFGRVYVIDLPGCGFSPLPASGALTLEGHFEVLRRFLSEVVREPSVLLGNSLGGALTLLLALRHPELLLAAVPVAPAGAPSSPEALHEVLEAFRLETDEQVRAFVRRLFVRPAWPMLRFPSFTRAMVDTPAVRKLLQTLRTDALLKDGELSTLRVPLRLIWGGNERLLPNDAPDFFRAQLPPAFGSVALVPHFNHLPQLEFPRDLVAHVVEFARQRQLLHT